MKKEEAIQILSTRDWSGMLCGYTSGYTEALDMAVEALQKDIERQKMITRISKKRIKKGGNISDKTRATRNGNTRRNYT